MSVLERVDCTSIALEKSKKKKKNAKGKLKLPNFLMDSVLILLYGFSSYHWRWCIWPPPCGHVVRHSVEVSIPCDRQLTNSYHFDVAPLPNKMIPQCFNEKMQRPKQRRLEVSRLAWPTWGKITKIYIVSVTCKNVSMIRISFLCTQLSLEMLRNAWQKTYANYLNTIKLQDNVDNTTSIAEKHFHQRRSHLI